MDNKTIFVKTSKGEQEAHGGTSHLPGDLKRALLMVDGSSTFGEISKRAAPSMRASLGETFGELEKTGLIQDKAMIGKIPKVAVPPKMSVPGKMSVPSKAAAPQKKQPADDDAGELDFLTGFPVTPPEKPAIVPDKAKSLMDEVKEKSKQLDTDKKKTQREAEAILHKAEQDAARIREETARRGREEAETIRLKAEQEARKMRESLDSAKLKNEQEAKLRLEAAIREQQLAAEEKRLLAERARIGREEIESAKLKSEQEAKLRLDAAMKEQQLAVEAARLLAEQKLSKEREDLEAAKLKIEQESRLRLEAAARERERAEAARIKAEKEAEQILVEMEMAKLKAEQEAKARLEAEAKAQARIKAEEEATAIARQAAELLLRQEREEAEREAAARAVEGREAAARATKNIEGSSPVKPDTFAFDQFQIEEQKNLAAPRQDRGSAKKAAPQDTFVFDSFQVDESQRPAESKAHPPAQKSGPAQRPGAAAKNTGDADSANESSRTESDKEQIDREQQERIAAEARAKEIADAQAKEIADAQARVWAEAEQRALESAKSNAERAARQAEYSTPEISHVEKPVRVARARRKPFAWGKLVGFIFKLGLFLLVLLAGALFIVPYALPMRDYMPKVQEFLSARLHQPVHLGSLSGRILPMPRLDLGEIYIGDAKQFQAVDAQINFDPVGLFTDAKPISSVEFHNVKVRGPWVRDVAAWLQQLASDKLYPVSRITISQGTLDADVFQLTGMEGNLNFDPSGKFTQANLRSDGGKYAMDINATQGNRLETSITVRNSALPMLSNWTFDELDAKGELSSDELLIKNFDAKMLGGIAQGDATINWRSGWRVQGTLSVKSVAMKNVSKLLDGNVEGSARFKMASADLAGLTDSATLDGSFKASDGMISGLDIVETARMRSKENVPGGRTHFDDFGGGISYVGDTYHFKDVKIDAGVMNAVATFNITKQQLSGKMNVKLSAHDVTAPVVLQMGGAIDNPTLVYAP